MSQPSHSQKGHQQKPKPSQQGHSQHPNTSNSAHHQQKPAHQHGIVDNRIPQPQAVTEKRNWGGHAAGGNVSWSEEVFEAQGGRADGAEISWKELKAIKEKTQSKKIVIGGGTAAGAYVPGFEDE
jgi:hypothetical protein